MPDGSIENWWKTCVASKRTLPARVLSGRRWLKCATLGGSPHTPWSRLRPLCSLASAGAVIDGLGIVGRADGAPGSLGLRRATKIASWQATSSVSSAATAAYKAGRGETLLGAVPDTTIVITGC